MTAGQAEPALELVREFVGQERGEESRRAGPRAGGPPTHAFLVNLILFEPDEIGRPLPRVDPRAQHVLGVLRRQTGAPFDAAVVDGPRGTATVRTIEPHTLTFDFAAGPPLPPRPATVLLLGLPRPQTARDILRDATTLGSTALHFVSTERSDANYGRSSLWTTGEWRRHVLAGAGQAFDPRVPQVTWQTPLATALREAPADGSRYALDNYEADAHAAAALAEHPLQGHAPVVIALGPERGWGSEDRDALRAHGFRLVHLGSLVLRVETAVVAALTLVAARRATTPPSANA